MENESFTQQPRLEGTRFIRKMRGGAQAHLIATATGELFVVKSPENPQGTRTLVNEWIAHSVFRRIGISVPDIRLVHLSDEFLLANPEVCFSHSNGRRVAIGAGLHLGISYVGNGATSVYDFLPTPLLYRVVNSSDFIGALVADKWLANEDCRQAVFVSRPGLAPRGWQAHMIDHGLSLGGRTWRFLDSPGMGLYHDYAVYSHVCPWNDFEPWIARLSELDEKFFSKVIASLPDAWVGDDRPLLSGLIERLIARRKRVPDLLCDLSGYRENLFATACTVH